MRQKVWDDLSSLKIALMVLWVLLYPGCMTLETSEPPQGEQINVPDCFDLSLRDDVPISVSVRGNMIALTYEETMIDSEQSVSEDTSRTNLYTNLIGIFEPDGFSPRIARLTINMWIINTTERTKICYQWRLTDAEADGIIDEVAGEIVTEDWKGTVTGINPLSVPYRDMDEYTLLYRSCLDHFLERLNLHSIDELIKLPADNHPDSLGL
jgi:hypothetical protein